MSIELRLVHIGDGAFRTATRLDLDLSRRALTTNETVVASIRRKRSKRQNAFFHALIQAAFDNQRAGPEFPSVQHLRAWLLIEAGHCDEVRVSVDGMNPAAVDLIVGGMSRALKQKFESLAVSLVPARQEVVIRMAKSVSFAAADADQIKPVIDRVVDLICTKIVPGIRPKQLFEQAKAA